MVMLRQDAQAQASFSWHDDRTDLKYLKPAVSDAMVTAIVQLTDGETAMRLHSFEPFKFAKAGDCVCFSGAAVHESVPRKSAPVVEVQHSRGSASARTTSSSEVAYKIAFFLD